jgi:hypothetical protein
VIGAAANATESPRRFGMQTKFAEPSRPPAVKSNREKCLSRALSSGPFYRWQSDFMSPANGAGADVSSGLGTRGAGEADPLQNLTQSEISISSQVFSLREWLANIRGCLEREAATWGLGFDLRIERAVPDRVDGDPAWLGGLVVAMGREALDATSDSQVKVKVYDEAGDTLRIEVDAGNVGLAPVAGMQEVACSVGGEFRIGAGRSTGADDPIHCCVTPGGRGPTRPCVGGFC